MSSQDSKTLLTNSQTHGLGEIIVHHPTGTFGITPASRISIESLGAHQHLLKGTGLDWGTGTGCLAILASRIPEVNHVIGMDISAPDIAIAGENAQLNCAQAKTSFIRANSYKPYSQQDAIRLDELRGTLDFVISNPPSSENDDGFGFR
jgi:methylase of polypeptide subunit release factors